MIVTKEKVVCLVSGGIDSPVALVLAARWFEVLPLHFCLYPYTCEDSFLVAMRVLGDLKRKVGFEKAVVYPWSPVLRRIMGWRDRRYACLLCRRGMFRVAELICQREGAAGIVTGESLGQKASQTLSNLWATTAGVRFPVLRPLLGLDKVEIEQLSKQLGIWHEVHAGCCYATPRYPRTRANPATVDSLFRELNLDDLIREQLGEALEVRSFQEEFRAFLEKLT
ncbi:MAG: hypothetical protein ACP5PX_05605 [Candidatus Hadarchaeum sp.]|uniref:hypothetical protein n=1 Tax=Candidatus Hadarchaeum sp. TaxID=2883567 RepID=UPI003D0ECAB6